jgi:hypothetical protein
VEGSSSQVISLIHGKSTRCKPCRRARMRRRMRKTATGDVASANALAESINTSVGWRPRAVRTTESESDLTMVYLRALLNGVAHRQLYSSSVGRFHLY